MNRERVFQVLLGPHVSEKSTIVTDLHGQHVFKVAIDANKHEIKHSVEQLFDVKVATVRTIKVKGKTKRTARGLGRRSDWKKAYVALMSGYEIDLLDAEQRRGK